MASGRWPEARAEVQKRKHQIELDVIGYLRSCFKEKFGIPRQPGLVASALGTIKLEDDPDLVTAIKGFEGFSHLWVIFVFHRHGSRTWKPSIRPPRLGGRQRVGVLASRSPHRPNPIGMSVLKIEAIRLDAVGGAEIDVSGIDLMDETPILDIKPYIPYADSVPEALAGWADEKIRRTPVTFTETAERALEARGAAHPQVTMIGTAAACELLRRLIIEILEIDPRPGFQRVKLGPDRPEAQGTQFAFRLHDFDVKWEIRQGSFLVTDLVVLT